jgi:hypothetical protein
MLDRKQIDARMKALQADVQAAYNDLCTGRIKQQRFDAVMDKAEAEKAKLEAVMRAKSYGSCASPAEYQQRALSEPRSKSAPKRNELAFLPTHLSQEQWHALHKAAESRAYGMTVSVADSPYGQQAIARCKARMEYETAAGDSLFKGGQVGLKAPPSYSPLEGTAGSLLEPLLIPDAFRQQL